MEPGKRSLSLDPSRGLVDQVMVVEETLAVSPSNEFALLSLFLPLFIYFLPFESPRKGECSGRSVCWDRSADVWSESIMGGKKPYKWVHRAPGFPVLDPRCVQFVACRCA